MSYYDDLGVARNAPTEEIERAYRAAAQKYHPDKHPGREQQAAAAFKRIQEAFQVLRNPKARRSYDETLKSVERPDDEPVREGGGIVPRDNDRRYSESEYKYTPSNAPKRHWFEWISTVNRVYAASAIGTVFVIAAALTVFKRPPSAEDLAAQEKSKAEARASQLAIEGQVAELERGKSQRAQETAVAKAKLQAVLLEGDRAHDAVRSLIDEIKGWDATIPPLLTDEKGKLIAASDDRIRAFKTVWSTRRPTMADANAIKARIDGLTKPIETELAKAETLAEPTIGISEQLKKEATTTDSMTQELRSLKRQIDRLVEVATREGKSGKLTLQDAVSDLDARDATERNTAIATTEQETRKQLTAAEVAKAEQERKNRLAMVKAQQDLATSDTAKKIKHDELVARANSPEIRTLLAFFFTPGHHQPDGTDTAEKRPISLSRLDAQGCLDPSLKGQQQLLVYALLNGGDNDRPKWQEAPAVEKLTDTKRAQLIEIQKALIELGPALVELKLLDP